MKPFKYVVLSSLITLIVVSLVFAYFLNTSESRDNLPEDVSLIERSDTNLADNSIMPVSTNEEINNISNSRQNIITQTVKKVSPAVVGINVTEIRYYRSPWSTDPFWRQFFGDGVYSRPVKGLGSGTIISPDGYIITNDHVAGNASKIIITMTSGSEYPAEIVGTDMISDICLLKIDAEDLPYVDFGDSDNLLIGEWVIALGNPFGLFKINDKPSVTIGVVSSTGMDLGASRERYYYDMIQTDASINTGNSGGPLMNSLGDMIGMNTLIFSESGGSVGIGFAIPINKIKMIINELKNNGVVNRDFWTGLSIQNVDEQIAKYYQLQSTTGVIITFIAKNSPADKAGLQVGDIIIEVDKFRINDENIMIGVLHEYRTNDVVNLKIKRDDQTINKSMKLEERND